LKDQNVDIRNTSGGKNATRFSRDAEIPHSVCSFKLTQSEGNHNAKFVESIYMLYYYLLMPYSWSLDMTNKSSLENAKTSDVAESFFSSQSHTKFFRVESESRLGRVGVKSQELSSHTKFDIFSATLFCCEMASNITWNGTQ